MEFMENIARSCMPFLYFLESIRNPVLDAIFSTITHLGEETFFLVIAIFFFWCVNKREGYIILITGLVGTVVNGIMKNKANYKNIWFREKRFENKLYK